MLKRTLIPMAAGILLALGTVQGQEAEPDFASILTEEETVIEPEIEIEDGDMKPFKIVTEDDISAVEEADIYKSNTSFFRVTRVRAKGAKGGRIVVVRTSGDLDPGRKWTRVSGLGPATVTSRETMMTRFFSGGPLMYPIAFLLLGVIVIALNSGWVYRREKQCPAQFVQKAGQSIESGDLDSFASLARGEKGLLPRICEAMALNFAISTEEDIRIRAESEAKRQIGYLRLPLRTLNFIAAVAPLLGLLGTVMGMIASFDSLATEAASAYKSQAMAAGIKVALLTTAFGLSVAVPALFVYFVFNARLSSIIADCEGAAAEFVHRLSIMKRPGAAEERA